MGKSDNQDPEILALQACVNALSCLDGDAQIRVTEYFSQRFMEPPESLFGNILQAAANSPETDKGGRFGIHLVPKNYYSVGKDKDKNDTA